MVPVRRVVRPIRVAVMRREQFDAATRFGDSVEFADESYYVRNVFNNVVRHAQVEFVVRKRIGYLAEVMYNVGSRSRIIIQPYRAFSFIRSTADIEDLGHRNKTKGKRGKVQK